MRRFFGLAAAGGVLLTGGCASTWDVASSRRFREQPFATMFEREDPLVTLRTKGAADASERARAIQGLKEPAANGQGAETQEEVMAALETAATADASPWVRVCAIQTLGRFQDPRVPEILANAYHRATGPVKSAAAEPNLGVEQAGVRPSLRGAADTQQAERLVGLLGPQGFAADQVANLRRQAVTSLAKTGHPKAVEFLKTVALGKAAEVNEDPLARDMARQGAVEGLGQIRQPAAVEALSAVLTQEQGRDVALASLAHTGLKSLTGKDLPADAAKWGEVVQAGAAVVPEPGGVERAVNWVKE